MQQLALLEQQSVGPLFLDRSDKRNEVLQYILYVVHTSLYYNAQYISYDLCQTVSFSVVCDFKI